MQSEITAARAIFSVFDFEGTGSIDASHLGDALRASGLTPTQRTVIKLGGSLKKGEKRLTEDEFIQAYQNAKSTNETSTLEEYVECLKTNSRTGKGMISTFELTVLLQSYGERLTPKEVEEIIRDCADPEENLVECESFVRNLLAGPKDSQVQFTGIDALQLQPIPESSPAPRKPKPKEQLSSAQLNLKTTKMRKPSMAEVEIKQQALAAATEEKLKPKHQMPLISMKTRGLIGDMAKKVTKG